MSGQIRTLAAVPEPVKLRQPAETRHEIATVLRSLADTVENNYGKNRATWEPVDGWSRLTALAINTWEGQ